MTLWPRSEATVTLLSRKRAFAQTSRGPKGKLNRETSVGGVHRREGKRGREKRERGFQTRPPQANVDTVPNRNIDFRVDVPCGVTTLGAYFHFLWNIDLRSPIPKSH